jgi:nucleoside-diphosphate-sugar epimerase
MNSGLVLVTGSTGAIGPSVINALKQAGCRIRSFALDVPVAGTAQGVEVLQGDITDRTAVQSAMQGVDAVVHMAALLHVVNPRPEMQAKYERINVDGTEMVVNEAIRAGVRRVVLFSTIAVYGSSNGQVLHENSPTHPDTFYAQSKLSAERIVLNARSAAGQPLGTVLRLAAVYGPRIKGNYDRLVKALKGHYFIPVGDGRNRRTMVYDKDVGQVAVLSVSHPAAAGRVFNVTDGNVHTLNEIIASICSALGRRTPCLSLPELPVRILLGLIEKGGHALGLTPPVTRKLLDKYTEDIAVDGSLILKELGFTPRYDLQTGWQDAIQDMLA